MNLPNKLTVARIIATPFFIVTYMRNMFIISLIIFILASVTDMVDGKIARKYDLITDFGKIMDPLADKVLVYSAFCLLVGDAIIPSWAFIIILAREFLIAGMRTVAASQGIVIAAGMAGKVKTVVQMIAVPILILALSMKESSYYPFVWYTAQFLIYASVVMNVYSGGEYVLKNKSVFKQ